MYRFHLLNQACNIPNLIFLLRNGIFIILFDDEYRVLLVLCFSYILSRSRMREERYHLIQELESNSMSMRYIYKKQFGTSGHWQEARHA